MRENELPRAQDVVRDYTRPSLVPPYQDCSIDQCNRPAVRKVAYWTDHKICHAVLCAVHTDVVISSRSEADNGL